jgi:hypothetical protein
VSFATVATLFQELFAARLVHSSILEMVFLTCQQAANTESDIVFRKSVTKAVL